VQYIVTLGSTIEVVKKAYFANEGDYYEKSYWPLLKEKFPNCEDYWRHFVVPITRRMEANVTDQRKRTLPREHVSDDVLDLASLHYSMFMHLVCGYDHMMSPRLSSFEDFYVHLAAACDLAEDFLAGSYLLIVECVGGRANVSQLARLEDSQRTVEDQTEAASARPAPAPGAPPGRQAILDDYFGASDDWKQYRFHARKIREYRDAVWHNIQIGRVVFAGEMALVPRKEHIQEYRRWPSVFLAAEDPGRLQNHFIDMKEQMLLDIETVESMLNKLWHWPTSDMKRLFFDDKNPVILGKYQITPT
jgi:hypothetical protein